ncbi:MAG: 30S ribosomal protein S21 [Anaerolineales bacterium]|nr:30S ribosomal protein S21 [Anaerolineales bacterium]
MPKPGIGVRVRRGEDIDSALRRFRKKCEKEGLFNEIRRRSYYEKPSEVKHRKKLAALRKMRKKKNKRGGKHGTRRRR